MSDIKVVSAQPPHVGDLGILADSFEEAVRLARHAIAYEPCYHRYPVLLLELDSIEIVAKHPIKSEMSEHTYRFRIMEGR